MPDGVSVIGSGVFKGSKNIKRIVIDAVNPPYVDGKLFEEESIPTTLKVPEGAVSAYFGQAAWKVFSTITPY